MNEANSQAFNKGCDARLNGFSRFDNPYLGPDSDPNMATKWYLGWDDVDRNWGRAVRVAPKLAEVRA